MRVLPVRVEVSAQKQFCSLSLANAGSEPVTVQIRAYRWSQDSQGKDLLASATDMPLNPAIATIKAGEARMIRCGLPDHVGQQEDSYRLIIDELPRTVASPGQVQTLLRLSVPVFRAPAGAGARLGWVTGQDAAGKAWIELTNTGHRHLQIGAIQLHLRANGAPVKIAKGFYLLAGSQTRIVLPIARGDDVATVEADTDVGPLTAVAMGRASGE
ncbi:MAG: molecular chaperone [Sphingomonadales bacterium]|nr:molecular chaperone [Sphingomonadales bacterium]MDE2168130.1 molecular chaperone [Sphingomonadales bacterium]